MDWVHGRKVLPLPGANFGRLIDVDDAETFVGAVEQAPDVLPALLCEAGGLLVLKGMGAISGEPELLVRLSHPFGSEVEDYAVTSNRHNLLHPASSQIIRISNRPPMNFEPPQPPDPPRTADGGLPSVFRTGAAGTPIRVSAARHPISRSSMPMSPPPRDQGQTLYADGTGAWERLDDELAAIAENLVGIHVAPFKGHGEDDAREGREPQVLNERDGPQPQPVVRVHPVSGRKALYLCEREQMDWINGPFAGMEPGVKGEAARLLYRLMHHFTQPALTYAHHWDKGDLVVYDNRCTIHSATWFDATNTTATCGAPPCGATPDRSTMARRGAGRAAPLEADRQAPVDGEDVAVNVRRRIAGKVERRPADVSGSPQRPAGVLSLIEAKNSGLS